MKKLLFLTCATLGLSVHAQYFTHDYGNALYEQPQNGMNTTINSDGFIMAGNSPNSMYWPQLEVLYADNAGNITGGFNNVYQTIALSGVGLQHRDGKVLEQGPNSFGVAGSGWDVGSTPQASYVYYFQLDALGNVMNTSIYNAAGYDYFTVNAIKNSVSPGDVFITGVAKVAGALEYMSCGSTGRAQSSGQTFTISTPHK
jgi:hypothetical protein